MAKIWKGARELEYKLFIKEIKFAINFSYHKYTASNSKPKQDTFLVTLMKIRIYTKFSTELGLIISKWMAKIN